MGKIIQYCPIDGNPIQINKNGILGVSIKQKAFMEEEDGIYFQINTQNQINYAKIQIGRTQMYETQIPIQINTITFLTEKDKILKSILVEFIETEES